MLKGPYLSNYWVKKDVLPVHFEGNLMPFNIVLSYTGKILLFASYERENWEKIGNPSSTQGLSSRNYLPTGDWTIRE
jgi:hypothetical protein